MPHITHTGTLLVTKTLRYHGLVSPRHFTGNRDALQGGLTRTAAETVPAGL